MAIYAIGDIQGCYDELLQLLNKINFNSDRDQLWFTGDLVNRGPKSLDTLRLVKSMADNAIVVLGNHDLHLLATAYDHNRPGRKDTFSEVLNARDKESLIEWLSNQPLLHVDNDLQLVMVHASLHPQWNIEMAMALAREVEQVLNSDNRKQFYRHMYGDKPEAWSNSLSGWDRLRFITNVFTRVRYCDLQGNIHLGPKGAPGSQPEGLIPWFNYENRELKNTRIIFGHWSTLILSSDVEYHNVYPLDTGCLWGGKLTAMRIDVEPFELYQIDCPDTGLIKKYR